MKKFYLLAAAALCAAGTFAQDTRTFADIADTWVRENNVTWKGEKSDKMELSCSEVKTGDEVTGYTSFAGLLAFEYELPAGMKVDKAELKLVTERYKGGDVMLRAYGNDFAESTCWRDEADYIADALDAEPLVTFTPAGQKGKATYDGLSEQYQTLDAWINIIDVTNYLKSLPATATRVNFFLSQANDRKLDSDCFYTKENKGITSGAMAGTEVSVLVPELTVTFVEDANSFTGTFLPAGDTFVRTSAADNNYGSNTAMEIYTRVNGDGSLNGGFYGLMNFSNLPIELNSDDYELKSAQLRLVTVQCKGDRWMNVYAYPEIFDEGAAKYNNQENNVAAAFEAEPICEFEMKGQGTKSMGDGGLNDTYSNAEAWTNYIDLTDYIKSLDDKTSFAIMLAKKNTQTNGDAMKIGTKEATDIESKTEGVTFPAADLRPQLVLAYSKSDTNTSIEHIATADENAPVEYFNLQGVRVVNPTSGLYIRRQGNTVTKVIL